MFPRLGSKSSELGDCFFWLVRAGYVQPRARRGAGATQLPPHLTLRLLADSAEAGAAQGLATFVWCPHELRPAKQRGAFRPGNFVGHSPQDLRGSAAVHDCTNSGGVRLQIPAATCGVEVALTALQFFCVMQITPWPVAVSQGT